MSDKIDVAEVRWENGTDHHEVSEALVRAIANLDVDYTLDLKMGGDGDVGETLAYYIDELIDRGDFSIMDLSKDGSCYVMADGSCISPFHCVHGPGLSLDAFVKEVVDEALYRSRPAPNGDQTE
jgi:hypothetical protein